MILNVVNVECTMRFVDDDDCVWAVCSRAPCAITQGNVGHGGGWKASQCVKLVAQVLLAVRSSRANTGLLQLLFIIYLIIFRTKFIQTFFRSQCVARCWNPARDQKMSLNFSSMSITTFKIGSIEKDINIKKKILFKNNFRNDFIQNK